MTESSARLAALKDISEHHRNQGVGLIDGDGDFWTVTSARINTKEQRKLNAQLGLNKVNYIGNKNAKR